MLCRILMSMLVSSAPQLLISLCDFHILLHFGFDHESFPQELLQNFNFEPRSSNNSQSRRAAYPRFGIRVL